MCIDFEGVCSFAFFHMIYRFFAHPNKVIWFLKV